MAERDFAQVSAQVEVVRPEDVRPIGSKKMTLFAIAVVILVAAGFAGGFKFGYITGEEAALGESKARLVAQLEVQKQELERLRREAKARVSEVSTTQVGELTFYNELPKQSVEPAPLGESDSASPVVETLVEEATAVEADPEMLLQQIIENELKQRGGSKRAVNAKAATDSENSYYVQAASFKDESDATRFLAKLQGVSLPAKIRRVDVATIGVRYRVVVGPYPTRQQADASNFELKSKMNVTGLVVKGG